ncbi:CotH kinase family protein [Bacteroides cellulolyticus]|uniref:CotH kinase family protein n=1 Tax=Bacteroides cellulolyticus TaxID=2981780 RepID=UPI0021CF9588|nr:CotH kinase family protein [Bacteroides cellulolyticus]MCU6772371.1 CotH kinase family protein [Bacteroides cellulolyticus]
MLGLEACREDSFVQNESKGNVTIVGHMGGDVQTRTCVDNSSPDGVAGILWSPKDIIGVYGDKGTKNAMFESANTGNVAEAEFNGTMAAGEYPTYAYYPYSASNAAADVTALKGNLKLTQTFDMTTGKLEGDYKVGTPTFKTYEGRYEFEFEHLFSLLKFDINATGTALEGDALESIILTLPEGRRLGGEFTFDATSKAVTWTDDVTGTNVLTMNWSDTPALASGKSYTGYITCAPEIRTGDQIKITILTQKFKAEFTCTALVDFAANTCYTFPLSLENYEGDMEVTNRPVFTSFSFEAKNNAGKILDKKLVFNGSATRPVDSASEELTVDGETITGCIPYLYNFNLKPTFAVNDGTTVKIDGVEQTSGVSEVDFSNPVVYTLSNGEETKTFTVTVTNSGLPVVVLTQSGGGSESWAEAGINVRSKDADWVETDKMAVYNADGSVDMEEAFCGIRLRGNSTQKFPKKPFAMKLVSKASVLGMPKHKRWVLLANWMDRTMLRNAVAFEVAHQTENAYADGLGWNPHGYSVEVIMDGRHVGNYFLCEQIKIDGDRVDIKDCIEDIIGDGNTNPTMADCGYLLEFDDNYDEVDKFRTGRGLPCMFKDEVSKYSSDIYNQVKARIEAVESNLEAGNYEAAYNDLDINSVIDYFFVQELTFNDEYKHPKSVYMLIDGDGKLTAGPVWDFDWQTFINYDKVQAMNSKYGGTYSCRNTNEWLYGASKLAEEKPWWQGGGYDYVNDMPYMWYPLLFKDANFRTRVQERWTVIYPQLLSVATKIDELATQNKVSDQYNYAMWPLSPLKVSVGSAFNGDEDMTFDEAISSMKKAYSERLEWMNTNIIGGNFVTNAK